jgi:hypothetical protein
VTLEIPAFGVLENGGREKLDDLRRFKSSQIFDQISDNVAKATRGCRLRVGKVVSELPIRIGKGIRDRLQHHGLLSLARAELV